MSEEWIVNKGREMLSLAFDTSSQAMTVALMRDSVLLATFTMTVKKNHSISLMPTIDFIMSQVGCVPSDLERIIVAKGPGSYTGLRVAVATAKTLAYSLGIDLVGVSSLQALAADVPFDGLVVPLMDARRRQVYAGFYVNGRAVQPDRHMALADLLTSVSDQEQLAFVGETSAFAEEIKSVCPQARVIECLPSAVAMARIGQDLPKEDCHAFVPDYLKRVEAEENWLQAQGLFDSNEDYIKRV